MASSGKKATKARWAAATRADRIVREMQTYATQDMSIYLRQPERFTDLILALDDDPTVDSEAEFSRRVDAAEWLSRDELATIKGISNMASSLAGEDAITLGRWAQHRVIYQVDSDTAAALTTTDWEKTRIPGEVLARLPHPNPAVVLPAPFYAPYDDGGFERYTMFVISGTKYVGGERTRCSTLDPQMVGLTLHFYATLVDEYGVTQTANTPDLWGRMRTVTPVVGLRILTPLTEDLSMAERIDYATRDMVNRGPAAMVGWADANVANTAIGEMTTFGLSLLTYLCSDKPDFVTAPTTRRGNRSAATSKTAATATVIDVGFTLGASLRTHAATAARDHTAAAGTDPRRTVAPHIRRAHAHLYRVGQGRKDTILKWLPPIAVNPDADDTRSQIHPV